MDVKYVPIACHSAKEPIQYYQYTMIEEASRKRFIYAYEEHSSYSTVDFMKRAIIWFGYAPCEIQTDCGAEFTHTANTKRVHPMDVFCNHYGIRHHVLRPRTPWHNGKVERSHRNDQERFYNYLKFFSIHDLQVQMKRYLYRSNNIPMSVLYSVILGGATEKAMYASIIASNIAAYITPIGALAGIMFMELTKSLDSKISFLEFLKYGVLIGIPTIVIAITALEFIV